MRLGLLTCNECDDITEAILSYLGFDVERIDWNCLGWSHPIGIFLYVDVLNVLSVAEKKGLEIVTTCNLCYKTIKDVHRYLWNNPELMDVLSDIIPYKGFGNCSHVIDVLYGEIQVIRDFVERELDLAVAIHPGCYYSGSRLKRLCRALGAKVSCAEFCCGMSYLRAGDAERSLEMARDLLELAKFDSNADLIVTACSSCLTHLEMAQDSLRRLGEIDFEIPILHYVQLLAICMGLDESIRVTPRDEVVKRILGNGVR